MSDPELKELAEQAGLLTDWTDYRSRVREIAPHTLRAVLGSLGLPAADAGQVHETLAGVRAESQDGHPRLLITSSGDNLHFPDGSFPGLAPGTLVRLLAVDDDGDASELEQRIQLDPAGRRCLPCPATPGYYRLEVKDCDEIQVAVAPPRAWSVEDATGGRHAWGLAAQLYSLRRRGDGGVGDYSALAQLARTAAAHGADVLALSPVHALFAADPNHFSPYAPSSRLFFNPLHADPAQVFGASFAAERIAALGLGAEFERLERLPQVDWPSVSRIKLKLLRDLWHQTEAELLHGSNEKAEAFRRYRAERGSALENHARFEALHAQQFSHDPARWHWRSWPADLRDPCSPAVARFAAAQADEIGFHVFLQWLADLGLEAAQSAAREAGMAIGLVADLAVGTDNGGSHSWGFQDDMLAGLSVGAPPDLFNHNGQKWGITTFSPRALKLHGYAPFIDMLRAVLRHAGGARIDHILGLQRLWLTPDGMDASEGVYLQYPVDDLFKLVSLESWRHRAVMIGEDLGTIPEDFGARLLKSGVMGMRVLWFERDHGLFVEPSRWPTHSIATTTTHDLATVAGWWQAHDIELRSRLGKLGEGRSVADELAERETDRHALWAAFQYAGVASGDPPVPQEPAAAVTAAIEFVAKTSTPLALIPAEDIIGSSEQPNLPDTLHEHPNWRRRLAAPAEELFAERAATQRLAALQAHRNPDHARARDGRTDEFAD